ncbi:MAG: NAD(P)-dependent oxidoreductase [Syntrophales bacterium]
MKQATIGFCGLGAMGYPMASRLAARGHALTVFDLDASRMKRFASEHGATTAAAARDLAHCGTVITMVPDSAAVEQAVLGGAGVPGFAEAMTPDSVVMDMSSSDPLRTRTLAGRLAGMGLHLVDAPVSGGVKRAVSGQLAIMAGGEPEWIERCRPLLECMGSSLFIVGASGAGHAVKALNNFVSAAGMVATIEALRAGEAFGLDPKVVTDVFNASTGRNNTTENKVAQFMLPGAYNSGFSLKLMRKDIRTALELGRALGLDMTLGTACLSLWDAAGERAGAADHTEMYRLIPELETHAGPGTGAGKK